MPESCRLCCVLAGICSIPHSPSAAGWSSTAGAVSDANPRSDNTPQDTDHLPPLEELFGDLQGDDYIERLEELAESLLREVTAEVEANPHRTNEQVSILLISRPAYQIAIFSFPFAAAIGTNELCRAMQSFVTASSLMQLLRIIRLLTEAYLLDTIEHFIRF